MDSPAVSQTAFVAAPSSVKRALTEITRPVLVGQVREQHSGTFSHVSHAAAAACVLAAVGAPKASRRRQKRVTLKAVTATATAAATGQKLGWSKFGKWGVHKFGGASLETADLYKTCGDLLVSQSKEKQSQATAAIVSAAGGMTDALIGVVNAAVGDMADAKVKLTAAADRQKSMLLELAPGKPELTDPVIANIDNDVKGIEAMLLAASNMRGVPPQMLELIAGLGEVWSAQTLAAYLNTAGVKSAWVDARDVLIVPDASAGGVGEKGTAMDTIDPVWDESIDRLGGWWDKTFPDEKDAPFLVITGFVCSTTSGRPTTLKRSGSDYSATIFAKILGASNVTFWKNVNGVYTADPRKVPAAFPIANMTFDEAMELAYFGGQVLHPSAMVPCIEERIPVLVRNVFNPSHPGTTVYGRGDDFLRWDDQVDDPMDAEMPVKAITSIEKISLVTISGASFLGTHGVAKRLMEALSNAGVNVILTSQGSSEHSISVAVAENDGELALQAVQSAFELEIARNKETRAIIKNGLSIMAVIGEGMKNCAGISGRFFNALGKAKVNIVAIAQGSSERNISAVVDRTDLARALRAAHDGFTLSELTVAVAVIGTGMVGSEVIRQFARFRKSSGRKKNLPAMNEVKFLNIETRAVCDLNKMLLGEHGIPEEKMEEKFTEGSAGSIFDLAGFEKEQKLEEVFQSDKEHEFHLKDTNLDEMVDFLDTKRIPHKVIIDCTASDAVASKYPEWLRRGLHVITPNKLAGAGPMARYLDCLKEVGKLGAAEWHYEATVGSQLPVISMVHDLLQTGDTVHKVSGVLSGSLSYVFNVMDRDPGMLFSEAVVAARSKCLWEPDPTRDLSGEDTARKALILGRELGLSLEFEDIEIESLIPESLSFSGSYEKFDEDLKSQVDEDMKEKMQKAKDNGQRLFYSAEIDVESGKISIGLKPFPREDPPFALKEAEIIVQFVTQRFPEATPLVVRGPGAGAEVTASGVFASLLRLSKTLS
mmetsp:Transcript_10723/g.19063  ORF Transcript_10723/g.19063 Transcript_10723/m.19063 type:complete len:994 (-) Transcript_10723:305-3286(-)